MSERRIPDLNDDTSLRDNPGQLFEAPLMDAPKMMRDYLPAAFALFERRSRPGAAVGFPSGWDKLRDKFNGGLFPGLHILVGATGSGKTQLALQLALAAALDEIPVPVLFLALEADDGFADLVARLADMSGHKEAVGGWSGIYKGKADPDRLARVRQAAVAKLAEAPIYPQKLPPLLATPDAIRSAIKAWREAMDPDRPALVVLDYIQRVRGKAGDPRNVVGELSSVLRSVATTENAAILALSSTARANYSQLLVDTGGKKQRPRDGKPAPRVWAPGKYHPSELVGLGKEAGEIEYDADSVLTIVKSYRSTDEGEEENVKHWLAVAKQRAGKTGWVEMHFNGHKWQEMKASTQAAAKSGGSDASASY